jgi:hypothetical protein
VRLTVFDGDTAAADFDFDDNVLLVAGLPLGNFSGVATQETSRNGQTALSDNPGGGFRNARLDTGFFHTTDPVVLAGVYDALSQKGTVTFQLADSDALDNFFDFTVGIEGDLTDRGTPPTVVNAPPVIRSLRAGPTGEGSPVRVVVDALDPDAAGQPLRYEFDFDGDGLYEASDTAGAAQHSFPDEGNFLVAVRVVDADGASATESVRVEVHNVAPTLGAVLLSARTGQPVTLSASFTDPGRQDTFLATVDWGQAGITTVPLSAGAQSLNLTGPLGLPPGVHRVTLTLRDNAGGEAVTVLTLRVEGSAPPTAPAPAAPAPAAPVPAAPAPAAPPPPAPEAVTPVGPSTALPLLALPSVGTTESFPETGAALPSGPRIIQAALGVAPVNVDTLDATFVSISSGSQGEGQQDFGEVEGAEASDPVRKPRLATLTDAAIRSGAWFARTATEVVDRVLMELQGEAARIRPASADITAPGPSVSPPPAAAAPSPANAPAAPAATVQRGAAGRITALVLVAVFLHRSWTSSRASAASLLRRRWRRNAGAALR